jgi:hypothetical protein
LVFDADCRFTFHLSRLSFHVYGLKLKINHDYHHRC